MVAFGFAEVAANAVLLQHFDKLPAVLHQAILFAARDPGNLACLRRAHAERHGAIGMDFGRVRRRRERGA